MSAKANKQLRASNVVAAGASPRASAHGHELASLLTHSAFVLTLALIIARAMMSETLREAFDPVPGGDAAPRGVGPAGSLFLNAFCCVPAMLVLLRRAIDASYVIRGGWSHALLGALALWALLSTAWATDKFAALISASHLLAAAALLWSTTQLVRSWLRLRIVAGFCMGLLLVYTAQGLIYRFIDVPENVKFWEQNKDRILHERGWEPGSFQALQFEKKYVGGEMIGFNTSPNSFAAVLVLLFVISAGVAIQRYVSGDATWSALIALLMLPALLVVYFTNTRTAAGTLIIGAFALAVLGSARVRTFINHYRRGVYTTALIAVALATIAIIAHGAYHGTLFHDSLNFRWRYWAASAQLIRQHPLLGVGWSNFGDHYLAVRLPAAAEEVRDPHNFVVRAFAELGFIGGMIVLVWLARAAWEITRPTTPAVATPAPRSALFNAIAALVLGGLLNIAFAIDWTLDTHEAAAYVQFELARRVFAMGLIALGVALALIGGGERKSLDDRPAPWLLYSFIVAAGVFFVHALMDFVLAEPGPMMLFITIIGAALGVRTAWPAPAQPRARRRVILILSATALAWIVAVAAVVLPVLDAEGRAHQANEQIRKHNPGVAAGLLRSAFDTVPINADYAYRSATAMMMAGEPPDQIKARLAFAIDANPKNVAYYLTRAMLELRQPSPDFAAVQRDFDAALRLDPHNIPLRLDYAEALEKHGKLREAAAQYRLALETNEKYDKIEPKRLSPARVDELEQKIRDLDSSSASARQTPDAAAAISGSPPAPTPPPT